jgi:tetratricopeptide (TPR) repeat protein
MAADDSTRASGVPYDSGMSIVRESASRALELASEAAKKGDLWSAASWLRQAFASQDSLGAGWSAAVTLAQQIGDDHAAVVAARRLFAESSHGTGEAFILAQALTRAGQPGEAADLLVPIARAGKLSADQKFRLARMLMFAGRLDEAQAHCRALLQVHADSPTLWECLAQTKRFAHGDADIDRMRKVFERWTLSNPAAHAAIAMALAKAFVDMGDDAEADRYLEARAAARRATMTFDPRQLDMDLRDIVAWCESGEQDATAEGPAGSERPIFILGPARSGTSLLDQIFSRHPQVTGGGELRHFWLASRELGDYTRRSLNAFSDRMKAEGSSSDPWAEIGRRYLSLADERFGAGARFTDKLLTNVYRVRAIRRCLPGARFLYIKRNPLDVAWSCWRSQFDAESAWSTSQEFTALYIATYRRAMQAWIQRYQGSITEISYEQLTRAPDVEVPRVLAACGLQDHAATRQPHLSQRHVITSSFAQGREQIHTKSIDAAAGFPLSTKKLRAALLAAGLDAQGFQSSE